MERSLDPDLLHTALGETPQLPSPDEFANLIAEAELQILLERESVSDRLEFTGWYLHSVGFAELASDYYGLARQRAALTVAAHIFDVALQSTRYDENRRAELVFAAQVAAIASDVNPNAAAIYRREVSGDDVAQEIYDTPTQACCFLATALLAGDTGVVFERTRVLRDQIDELSRSFDTQDLLGTPLAAVAAVVLAIRSLAVFSVYGRSDRLVSARDNLQRLLSEASPIEAPNVTIRWVAAHLLRYADGLETTSIWRAMPPQTPEGVIRAFAYTPPRISSLWPPQVQLLSPEHGANPLDPSARRVFLSMPTSAGKTLIAQLMVVAHVAQEKGGVCYVAPTRSLCSEISRSLRARMSGMAFDVEVDLPEFGQTLRLDMTPDIEVLTPERLAYLLRNDPELLLSKYSMFVFDEAHNVGGSRRGWTLEGVLSLIHHATLKTNHRIVLISAAIGNRHHFVKWLKTDDDEVVSFHSDWRGPRRLHCMWHTEPLWEEGVREARNSKTHPWRDVLPKVGKLYARLGPGRIRVLGTQEPIGVLSLQVAAKGGKRTKESSKSTPEYIMLVSLIDFLRRTGPVLVIESTRVQTARTARAIANERAEMTDPRLQTLAQKVGARLGASHPITQVLAKGVAFHHGSLPRDVRELIEDGVRSGLIDSIVATTSLTEGVNLPVKSVVVSSQGAWTAEQFEEYIKGPTLLNAIGRAGRATLETEGVVVLVRHAEFDEAAFESLTPSDADLYATSYLATEKALEALATIESDLLQSEDALMETTLEQPGDFLSFVWFTAAELERTSGNFGLSDIELVLKRTLVWQQLSDDQKSLLLRIAGSALTSYLDTEPTRRRKWVQSGAAIRSARILESVAASMADIVDEIMTLSPLELIPQLLSSERMVLLCSLAESPSVQIYDKRSGAHRKAIAFSMQDVLAAWLRGDEIGQISEDFFQEVADVEYRSEQTADLVSGLFETHLPWVLDRCISWANEQRLTKGRLAIPDDLSLYLRWGLSSPDSLALFRRGLRSRRLANSVVALFDEVSDESDELIPWLKSLRIDEFYPEVARDAAELNELLLLVGERGVAATVFREEQATVPLLDSAFMHSEPIDVDVRSLGSSLPGLGVWSGDDLLGTIPGTHLGEVQTLLATGLSLNLEFEAKDGVGHLRVRMQPPPR